MRVSERYLGTGRWTCLPLRTAALRKYRPSSPRISTIWANAAVVLVEHNVEYARLKVQLAELNEKQYQNLKAIEIDLCKIRQNTRFLVEQLARGPSAEGEEGIGPTERRIPGCRPVG